MSLGLATPCSPVRCIFSACTCCRERLGREDQLHSAAAEPAPRPEAELLEFPEPDLLRATRLFNLMHRGGSLLSQRPLLTDTYHLSRVRPSIDFFISHNWAMRRAPKFLLLAWHFNMPLGVGVGVVLTVLITVGTCTGILPLISTPTGQKGFLGLCCIGPAFTFTLLFGHEVAALFGRKGPWVFLDRVCIHQTDEARKKQGILRLGAFMKHSSNVVVLFSHFYMRKLWTVYELATYLLLNNGDTRGLLVSPAGLAFASLASYILPFIAACCLFAIRWMGSPPWRVAQTIAAIGGSCAGLFVTRCWAHEQDAALKAIQIFSISDAECVVASDREFVRSSVLAIIRNYAYVDDSVTDEEALAAFDRFVRQALPSAVQSSLGRVGIPYKFLFPTIFTGISFVMDEWSASYRTQAFASSEDCVYHLLGALTFAFGTIPVVMGVLFLWGRSCINVGRVAELAYMALGVPVAVSCIMLLDVTNTTGILSEWVLDRAATSKASRAVFLTECAALHLAVFLMYSRPTACFRYLKNDQGSLRRHAFPKVARRSRRRSSTPMPKLGTAPDQPGEAGIWSGGEALDLSNLTKAAEAYPVVTLL